MLVLVSSDLLAKYYLSYINQYCWDDSLLDIPNMNNRRGAGGFGSTEGKYKCK